MIFNAMAKDENSYSVTNIHKLITLEDEWLNTSRTLNAEDLKGRILLLDFWTYCCINCIHVMPDLHYLEDKFGDDLTVIGVHSAKFNNERETENIRQAVLRYDIEHPVVNDANFKIWQSFGVRAWPTLLLISPDGRIAASYSGEGNRDNLEKDIQSLLKEYKPNSQKLPIALERDKEPERLLSFPGKMVWAEDRASFFVSNTNKHHILEVTPEGVIINRIGGGKEGLHDGTFAQARFNKPQGLAYQKGVLYVADTENHALRRVDLAEGRVQTIAGTGQQGRDRNVTQANARNTALASPWDVAFYPNENHLAIAMAGTHQLWTYDIKAQTVSVLAGNGRESIDDGVYPDNSLSQPSGLAVWQDKLYFVDSETSSLRVLQNGVITTLVGTGLFDFGFKDGVGKNALLQHALGVDVDATGVYIADAYNHAIRHYSPATKRVTTLFGKGKAGHHVGAVDEALLSEPNDVVVVKGELYIVDTNNHALKIMADGVVQELKLTESADTPAVIAFADSLPNALVGKKVVEASPSLNINLPENWKINEDAPSYLALFDADKKELMSIDHHSLLNAKDFVLDKVVEGETYYLQGILYYCEDKIGAPCLIKSVDWQLQSDSGGDEALTVQLENAGL